MATPDPQWYRDGVIYELNVRSFQDSNGDGIGDFPGLTRRLDYIQDLGVSAIWLLPFYPSPLRDDGYDIVGTCTRTAARSRISSSSWTRRTGGGCGSLRSS